MVKKAKQETECHLTLMRKFKFHHRISIAYACYFSLSVTKNWFLSTYCIILLVITEDSRPQHKISELPWWPVASHLVQEPSFLYEGGRAWCGYEREGERGESVYHYTLNAQVTAMFHERRWAIPLGYKVKQQESRTTRQTQPLRFLHLMASAPGCLLSRGQITSAQ